MEITVGLTTVVVCICLALTFVVGVFKVRSESRYRGEQLDWDWTLMIPVGMIGTILTFIVGVGGTAVYEKKVSRGKIAADKVIELAEIYTSLPEPWRLVFGFLQDEKNQGTRNLIVRRFTTEGYSSKPAPDITLDQQRYFTGELSCNGMGFTNCREWKCSVSKQVEPFVKFDMVAAVTPPPNTTSDYADASEDFYSIVVYRNSADDFSLAKWSLPSSMDTSSAYSSVKKSLDNAGLTTPGIVITVRDGPRYSLAEADIMYGPKDGCICACGF